MFKERYSRESEFGPIIPDRMDFIMMKNQIAVYLNKLFTEKYLNHPCMVRNMRGEIYVTNSNFINNKKSSDGVPFRKSNHNKLDSAEIPAFWVEVYNEDGSRNTFHSHLYLITEITLI